MTVSVVIIARNEERNIEACLRSAAWADETVVVDAMSTDATAEIAKRCGAKVLLRAWEGYSAARSHGIAASAHPWVFWLDADERVPDELAREIREVVREPAFDCYGVARRAYFLGKWIRHCGWYPGVVVRLFRKEKLKLSASRVHEKIEHEGPMGRLRNDLLHYTDETLYHYFSKFNTYTTLAALDARDAGKTFRRSHLVIRPSFMFFKMYVLRRGFLDGFHGLVLSLVSAAYVCVKIAKLWQLEQPWARALRQGAGPSASAPRAGQGGNTPA